MEVVESWWWFSVMGFGTAIRILGIGGILVGEGFIVDCGVRFCAVLVSLVFSMVGSFFRL